MRLRTKAETRNESDRKDKKGGSGQEKSKNENVTWLISSVVNLVLLSLRVFIATFILRHGRYYRHYGALTLGPAEEQIILFGH